MKYFGLTIVKLGHGNWRVLLPDGSILDSGVHSKLAAQAVVKMYLGYGYNGYPPPGKIALKCLTS